MVEFTALAPFMVRNSSIGLKNIFASLEVTDILTLNSEIL